LVDRAKITKALPARHVGEPSEAELAEWAGGKLPGSYKKVRGHKVDEMPNS
jgi:hypothetical protein